MRVLKILPLVLAITAPPAHADGMPDPSFGNGGFVQTNFSPGEQDGARGVLVTPTGKIVAGGYTRVALPLTHMAVARYRSDGELDDSFGVGGKVTVQFAGPLRWRTSGVQTLVHQPDGRVVLVGVVDFTTLALVRLNANGTEDTTFGTNGRVLIAVVTGSLWRVYAAALQPDGRILVFVAAGPSTATKPVVLRFNADGSLDSTFGSGGQAAVAIPDAVHSEQGGMALLPDGRILVAASNGFGSTPWDAVLIRLMPDGSPDRTFDGDGVLRTDWGGSETVTGVGVLGDGRIVVGGDQFSPGVRDLVVARYLSDGALDTRFGSGGVSVVDAGTIEFARAFVALPNGKLLMLANSNDDFLSVRFTESGALDTSFGQEGFLRTTFTATSQDSAWAMALYSSEAFVVAGYTRPPSDENFALVRYLAVVPVALTGFAVE